MTYEALVGALLDAVAAATANACVHALRHAGYGNNN
jgi:hypothetical protein